MKKICLQKEGGGAQPSSLTDDCSRNVKELLIKQKVKLLRIAIMLA